MDCSSRTYIDAFEQEICEYIGGDVYAAALNSGTAVAHSSATAVWCWDDLLKLTFVAANAITYVGAKPVFIDSDDATWNMDPKLLADALKERSSVGKTPKAVIPCTYTAKVLTWSQSCLPAKSMGFHSLRMRQKLL